MCTTIRSSLSQKNILLDRWICSWRSSCSVHPQPSCVFIQPRYTDSERSFLACTTHLSSRHNAAQSLCFLQNITLKTRVLHLRHWTPSQREYRSFIWLWNVICVAMCTLCYTISGLKLQHKSHALSPPRGTSDTFQWVSSADSAHEHESIRSGSLPKLVFVCL